MLSLSPSWAIRYWKSGYKELRVSDTGICAKVSRTLSSNRIDRRRRRRGSTTTWPSTSAPLLLSLKNRMRGRALRLRALSRSNREARCSRHQSRHLTRDRVQQIRSWAERTRARKLGQRHLSTHHSLYHQHLLTSISLRGILQTYHSPFGKTSSLTSYSRIVLPCQLSLTCHQHKHTRISITMQWAPSLRTTDKAGCITHKQGIINNEGMG